jgi:hypothetical protein
VRRFPAADLRRRRSRRARARSQGPAATPGSTRRQSCVLRLARPRAQSRAEPSRVEKTWAPPGSKRWRSSGGIPVVPIHNCLTSCVLFYGARALFWAFAESSACTIHGSGVTSRSERSRPAFDGRTHRKARRPGREHLSDVLELQLVPNCALRPFLGDDTFMDSRRSCDDLRWRCWHRT